MNAMLLNATISSQALSTFMCHHSSFLTPLKCCLLGFTCLHALLLSYFPSSSFSVSFAGSCSSSQPLNVEVPQSSAFASLLSLPIFTSLVIFFLTALNASYTLIIPTILPVCLTFSPVLIYPNVFSIFQLRCLNTSYFTHLKLKASYSPPKMFFSESPLN